MQHTIISWDCCFRNFFHLIGSLAQQKFPRKEYEFIYVEQRSKEESDAFNHRNGLPSLGDTVRSFENIYNVRVIYMNSPIETPYHLGRSNNRGLSEAKGDIISVMDGDVLVTPDFLETLSFHHQESGPTVFNLYRHMATHPVGVRYLHQWKKGVVDYTKCLNASETKAAPIPKTYGNKGPLISAPRKYWQAVGGYEESLLFSTSASTAGGDVCSRLERAVGKESLALPGQACVHPWHPIGNARSERQNAASDVNRYLDLQRDIRNHSDRIGLVRWKERQELVTRTYEQNRALVSRVIAQERARDESSPKIESRVRVYSNPFAHLTHRFF